MTSTGAADWPQWRGPERDGHVSEELLPDRLPPELTAQWSVEVGIGHASPIVVGERVYVFTRRGESETLSARDLASGKEIWSTQYPAPYSMNSAASGHGKGPKATPTAARERIFTLGIGGILSAFRAADGKLLWQQDFSDRFTATSPSYGAAMSPLVAGERVIAHVGGDAGGALMAFDAASGQTVWSWDGDGPAYASPVAAEFSGIRQVVTQSRSRVVGVALDTGRLLWSLPLKTPWEQNSVTPVVGGDLLIYSGLDQGTRAVRPRLANGDWSIDELWSNREVGFYMSTPVLASDRLCGFAHQRKGQFVCLDSASGAVLWATEGREGENAAVLAAGARLLALTDDAVLRVFALDSGRYAPVARYEVAASATWAHPVILSDGLLIKDKTQLTRLRFGASQ